MRAASAQLPPTYFSSANRGAMLHVVDGVIFAVESARAIVDVPWLGRADRARLRG